MQCFDPGWNPNNRPAYDTFLTTLLSSPDYGILEALRFLGDLHRHGCSPGPEFFRAALHWYHRKSDICSAIALWNDYIKSGVCRPDTVMYNYIIDLSFKERGPEVALRFFDEMVLHGAFPDSHTYNMLFQMLVQARMQNKALLVLSRMVKNKCRLTDANCLLAFKTKDLELCMEVWQSMLDYGIHPSEARNLLVSLMDDDPQAWDLLVSLLNGDLMPRI